MMNNLFVCSINEKYIASILQYVEVPVKLLGRGNLDYSYLQRISLDRPIIDYPYHGYRFSNMLKALKFRRFNEVYLPCYNVTAIPAHFLHLEFFSFFYARKVVFIDSEGNKKSMTRSGLIDQIAWHLFSEHFKLNGN